MANFDLDDPLGDLLSEGSNDSFFEEPKTLAKRSSLTKTPEEKTVSDLFGLKKSDVSTSKGKDDDWLGLGDDLPTPTTKEAVQRTANKPVKKISFDDDDENDIFSSLGIDKKSSANKTEGKKSSLMDSIFGTAANKQEQEKTTLDDILKESKAIQRPSTPKQQESQTQSSTTKIEPVKYGFSSLDSNPREGRRGARPHTSNIMDPLGLLGGTIEVKKDAQLPASPVRKRQETLPLKTPPEKLEEAKKEQPKPNTLLKTEVLFNSEKDMKTKSAPNLTDLPDWLGGANAPIRTHKSDAEINNIGNIESTTTLPQKDSGILPDVSLNIASVSEANSLQTMDALVAQQKLSTTHLGYQNTSLALQQQETQLVLALQLRKYEENLAEMQKQQHEILLKQEQQFNSLMERQFVKQQMMENNMRLQQERINSHIQLLMSQPPVSSSISEDARVTKISELKKANSEEIVQLYEQMISSLKQHQHEEIFLLEESYKKQIATLEASSEAVESRLKTELDSLEKKHRENLEVLKQENSESVEKFKKQLEELTDQHSLEIRKIKDNQSALIEDVRQEYNTMIDSIKQTKTMESSLFENSSSYAEKLEMNMKMLDINSKALLELKDKVCDGNTVLCKSREESMKAKEEEIKLMRLALEKAREMAETERSQLMGLVRTLEMKIAEQNQNSREERWALQQATATLTAKAAALDREVEYTRSSLEQERLQIKTLKESLLAEQERHLLQLTEEKLAVSAEKSRLKTMEKLHNNFDQQKNKVEIEAAIQAAQNATDDAYREKELLRSQQIEMENYKRKLEERERKLFLRENNLEHIVRSAEKKFLDGEKALNDAKNLENAYTVQLKDIQKQLSSLKVREKRLAEEKIALSKERLALNSLSKIKKKFEDVPSRLNDEDDEQIIENFEPTLHFQSDPELMRLRFEIEEDKLN